MQPHYFFAVILNHYFSGPLMKTPAPDANSSSTPVRKRTKTRPATRRRTDENTYTDPHLRERLRTEIRAAAKGGEPGTWSARKSQLLTLAYQKAGGGYLQRHPNSKPTRRTGTTTRHQTTKAWDELTPAEKKASKGKKEASKAGKTAVASAAAAKQSRKRTE